MRIKQFEKTLMKVYSYLVIVIFTIFPIISAVSVGYYAWGETPIDSHSTSIIPFLETIFENNTHRHFTAYCDLSGCQFSILIAPVHDNTTILYNLSTNSNFDEVFFFPTNGTFGIWFTNPTDMNIVVHFTISDYIPSGFDEGIILLSGVLIIGIVLAVGILYMKNRKKNDLPYEDVIYGKKNN